MSTAMPTALKKPVKSHKLGEFLATAVCGNDILSSALYVSGIAITFTGVLAPLVLLVICVVLFLYKFVYREVVEALPLNGGAYNCLLNGASKKLAATAGAMTILSYMATAVISGDVGVQYLTRIINVPVIALTIVLFIAFALLVISGIKDSAKLAAGIFALHIIALTVFLIFGLIFTLHTGTSQLMANLHDTGRIINATKGGIVPTLVLGFSASLLGVSGFESSANFVEEQRRGVFNKTLRNMLIGVTIFNPLIALIVLNSLSISASTQADNFLLAVTAKAIGGPILAFIISIDAFIVLWGAVLTAFVGVSGLMHRMAGDGCLPNFLTIENKRGSFPYIIVLFLILCCSILIVTKGDLLSLAGVYTIAFLGVMSFFAVGDLLLKVNRSDLKRPFVASALFAVIAFIATISGMIGNIYLNPHNFLYFCTYFIPTITLVFVVMYSDIVLGWIMKLASPLPWLRDAIGQRFNDIISGEYIAFVHHTDRLAGILNYIYRNETGRRITLIVCRDTHNEEESEETYHQLLQIIPYLRLAGVYPDLNVRVVYRDKESFGPSIIDKIVHEYRIRRNRICVGSIHGHHPYNYEELGGVRIIF